MGNFVKNDGGRAKSGYKGVTGDCVCRAISIITKKPYQEVYDALNKIAKNERIGSNKRKKSNARTGVYKYTYDKYLKSLGYRWVTTRTYGGRCLAHLNKKELPSGRLVVDMEKHMCAVINGVIHDNYDHSNNGTEPVHGYYIRNYVKHQK